MDSLRKPRSNLSLPPPSQPFHLVLANLIRSSFKHLGLYLSIHQIQALLFSAFIICCLLIPPASLYFSPDGPTSAIVRRGRGEMIWEMEGIMREGIISSEDEVCWDRLAKYYDSRDIGHRARVIRMEQVLISPSGRSGSGALSKRTLHHTLQLQNELERRLLRGEVEGMTCVRTLAGRCAISSPSNWWKGEREILADEDVHRTLSLPPRANELPLTITNTLVGVGRDRRGAVKGAHYLTMTFYLEDTSADSVLRGIGSEREEDARDRAKAAWREAVRDTMAGKGWESHLVEQLGRMREGMGQGRRIILKHLPFLTIHEHPRLFEDFLFVLGYLLAAFYVLSMMKGSHQVYSKVGLLFTGLVELVLSGIMSLSICWLLGLKVSLVPWKLIPFLVLVCGVDNMFVLINAIGGTDITLPVPERVAAGLSSIAVSTTVTLAIELTLVYLLLKFLVVEVIRELVTFTAVALVVDYVLEMTFFSAVLSIDIQRLELADLLRQGTLTARPSPSENGDFDALSSPSTSSSLSTLYSSARSIYKARAARTTTFSFLVFINLLLYSMYGSDHFLPAFCSEAALAKDRPLLGPSLAAEFAHSLRRGRSGASLVQSRGDAIVPGAGIAFWNLINPANASSVHVYIEPVTVVKFYDDEALAPESSSEIVGTSWWWRMGIVVVPISSVMLALYFILLYLLKDAELLELQRNHSSQEAKDRKRPKGAAGVEMTVLRGRHAADVEVISSSRDVVVSWSGLDESVILWSKHGDQAYEPTSLAIPITADPPSITFLAIDSDSKFCAATTMMCRTLIWSLDRKLLIDFGSTSRISYGTVLHLFPSPLRSIGSYSAPPGLSPSTQTVPQKYGFFTVHSDGHLVLWDCTGCKSSVVLAPSPTLPAESTKIQHFVITPSRAISIPSTTVWPIYARAHSTGQLQLFRSEGEANWANWEEIFNIVVTTPSDLVTSLAVGGYQLGQDPLESTRSTLVVGFTSGLVSLYDLESGRRICTIAEMNGPIKKIRLVGGSQSKCSSCSEPIVDGFKVVASTKTTLSIFRVYTLPMSSTCRCNATSAFSPSVRSSILVSQLPPSASKRSKRPTPISGSGIEDEPLSPPYPSPKHGFHLRKGSPPLDEVKKLIITNPGLSISRPVTPDSATGEIPLFDPSQIVFLNADGSEESPANSSLLPILPTIQVQSILSTVTDERGGWEVIEKTIIGVRRKQVTREEQLLLRLEGEGRGGPTPWEVWTIKLGAGLLSLSASSAGSSPASNTTGVIVEGATLLDTLLSTSSTSSTRPIPRPSADLATTSDTLRRRTTSATPTISSPLRPRTPTLSISLVGFEDVDLPFSRARPVLAGEHGLIVGLGNTVGLISEKRGCGFLMVPNKNRRL